MVQRDPHMRQIIPLIDNELIKVITGIRRCGKSYMLGLIKEELIKRGIKEHNIILINFENKNPNIRYFEKKTIFNKILVILSILSKSPFGVHFLKK